MENATARDIIDETLLDSFAHRIQETVKVFGGRGVIIGMWQHKELVRRLKAQAARTAALERVAVAADKLRDKINDIFMPTRKIEGEIAKLETALADLAALDTEAGDDKI